MLGVNVSVSGRTKLGEGSWSWSWGELGLGTWAGPGVGLNSRGEGLCLWLFVRGMQGVTERNSLNPLFGVSCTVLTLSSCIWGGSDSISREVLCEQFMWQTFDKFSSIDAAIMILSNRQNYFAVS